MEKRILVVSTVGLYRNGINAVIYNYLSHMDRSGLRLVIVRCEDTPEDICSTMDMLVMPSKWEGFPMTIVEAQANGLPVLASDTITQEVKCLESTQFISLTQGAAAWADKIQEIRAENWERTRNTSGALRERGFDIIEQAEILREIYRT